MHLDRPMSYAQALAEGATPGELRRARHPYRSIVSPVGPDEDTPEMRIANVVPMMTDTSVLTGWAAAYLQGVRMLDGRDKHYRELPIVIASPEAGQHRRRSDIEPTRRSVLPGEWVRFGGVNVATIARAAYDLALDAPDLREAIVSIDMCTSSVLGHGRTTLANVRGLLERHVKTRGIVKARKAVELASPRSASPWESRTRDVAQRIAGIETLKVNVPVFDLHGNLAGVADLLDEDAGFVIESDGSGHREELVHADDNAREEGFERLGLFVSRVGSVDHRDERALVDRLASGRLHARMSHQARSWTLKKPDWWWRWAPGRRWD